MTERTLLLLALALLPSASFTARTVWAQTPGESQLLPLISTHCLDCHGNQDSPEGDLDLSRLSHQTDLTRTPDLLDQLIEVLEDGQMPPEDAPQPTASQLESILQTLRELRTVAQRETRPLSQAPIRRMNRFQYNNAITDLFQLNCVVFSLPERMMREHRNYFQPATGQMADTVTVGSRPLGKSQMIEPRLGGVAPFPQDLRAEHGFDNRGDHLSMSPLLMESFLQLGQSIVESPDFNPKRVGVWSELFAPPESTEEISAVVQQRLDVFLSRAFRKPVDPPTLERYQDFVLYRIEEGATFTEAMKEVAAAAISSPKFLYLYDLAAPTAENEPLSDLELASRLSFFLWGSIPDDQLRELAATGKLSDDDVLSEQVDRMLRDERIKRFCDSFPAQWMQLERIISSVPDRQMYPDFYFSKYRDSMHMMLEPLLIFETVLIENRSIKQFIDSDFTYRSRLLREAYGEELSEEVKRTRGGGEVEILTFDRLPVTDRRHGGLITNAAVMTMTSGPLRTKPITRGAWLATVIFNDPPEPPPADVPPLAEKPDQDQQHLTLRERLSLHRERSDCRGCHEQIDPLGFALENYNAIGDWRDEYENGRPVDASGSLFRKHSFTNPGEFKDALLAESDRFATGFVEHLLSFALARQVDGADSPAVQAIVAQTQPEDYALQSIIRQVVLSQPFRHKRNPLTHQD